MIIATADRPQMVLDGVTALAAQVPPEVEVLAVDAGTDARVDEAALRREWANSRVIRASARNAALQRNEGAAQAKGDILVFMDDDCLVQPGWWPAILAPLAQADVGAVAGAVWCVPNPEFTDRRGGYVNWLGVAVQVTHRSAKAPREVDWPLTTNMAVRKRVMLDLGGFAPVFGIYDEDVDFGLRLRKAGWRIVFQPDAAVYHYFRTRPRKPPTRQSEFLFGRNRSLLLVRNYGVSVRLVLFLLTAPWAMLARATGQGLRGLFTAYGHAAAYVAGACKGVVDGVRNPVVKKAQRDKEAEGT